MTNPFEDPRRAARYEGWYTGPGRYADRLEKQLLSDLLNDFPLARTALDIGCGTGRFTRWLAGQGLRAEGLDISNPMLAEAKRLGGARFTKGDARALPIRDSEFDLVVLITTLKFVDKPEEALIEAVRVARKGLLLGMLNRQSWLAVCRRASGSTVWQAAQFFSVSELLRLVRRIAGSRLQSMRWRTTLWPLPFGGHLPLPWGGFIGLAARLSERSSGPATNL